MELHDAPQSAKYPTRAREGILTYHAVAWATTHDDAGVVSNLKTFLPALRAATTQMELVCDYDVEGNLLHMTQTT
jgi:hypothetical protein